MTKDYRNNNDDRLGELLRSVRPEPDSAFTNSVSRTLAALPEKNASTKRVSRPLIIIAVIIITLALGFGAAYASGAFGDIFGFNLARVQERADEHSAAYEDIREQIDKVKETDPMQAAELDNESDYWSEKDLSDLLTLTHAQEHAVSINQEADGVELTQFSSMSYDGSGNYEKGHLWEMLFAFTAPLDHEFSQSMSILIDGMTTGAYLTDLGGEPTETERYGVYECGTCIDRSMLPETSLISVMLGERSFCFIYNWEEESFTVPKDDAEREEWAEKNLKIHELLSEIPVKLLSRETVSNGFSAGIVSASLDGNKLILDVEVTAPQDAVGKTTYFDLDLGVCGWVYSSSDLGYLSTAKSDFTEDPVKRLRIELYLPVSPKDLVGEELTLTVYLDTTYPVGPSIEYEHAELGLTFTFGN